MTARTRTRLDIVRLEDRLAPANLTLTSLQLVDAFNVLQTQPVQGQKLYVRANWSASAMAGTESAPIRITANGFPLSSNPINFAAGSSSGSVLLNGWFAGTTALTVNAVIDPNSAVAESNEADNAVNLNLTPVAPVLPVKFVQPVGRVANIDYTVNEYMDMNPQLYVSQAQPNFQDARGGDYSYDRHDGTDSGGYGVNSIDSGFPIYTIADGTVTYVSDDHLDRQSYTNGSSFGNIIEIDHGNGWASVYFHLATKTSTVKVGDTIKQGQVIAQMGASGYSGGYQHLHFAVKYRGAVVETLHAPSAYWLNPLPYSADVPAFVPDLIITRQEPNFADIEYETSTRINTFSTTDPGTLYFNGLTYNARTPAHSTVMNVKFYQPNGVLWNEFPITYEAFFNSRTDYWYYQTPALTFAFMPGTWQFAFLLDGVEAKRIPFTMAASGHADMRVSFNNPVTGLNDQIIVDDRTTPLEFGSVIAGGTAPTMTITIANRGTSALTLGGYTAPPGFAFVSPPASVAANSTANLVVQMTTAVVGAKFGRVSFTTNDPEVPEMNFNVAGSVTGAPAAGTPAITITDKALGYNFKSLPRVFAPTATVSDSDSANFNTGTLVATFAAGGTAFDVLGIRHQGTTAGLIGVSGATVSFGGTNIGTFTGGNGTTPLTITLNASATVAATQALLRNLTYANTATTPSLQRRYIRLTLTDSTAGKVSNLAIAHVTPSGVERAPTIAPLATAGTATNMAFTRNGSFSDPYGSAWTATVKYATGGTAVALTLNPDKTFTLSNSYASAGTYTVEVTITSDTGAVSTATMSVIVVTPPTISGSGISVNDGNPQRSRITSITVTFAPSVNVAALAAAGSITLTRTAGGPATVLQTGATGANGRISINPNTGTFNSIRLTFDNADGSNITAGVEYGSLADGAWRLAIPLANYLSPLNDPALIRLFGNGNADNTLDGSDLTVFGNAFNTNTAAFDFNADGSVDGSDLTQLGNRFGITI